MSRFSAGERAFLIAVLAFDLLVLPTFALFLALLSQGHMQALQMPWTSWAMIVTEKTVRDVYLVLAGGLMGGAVWLVFWARGGANGMPSRGGETTFGSARWRSGRELLKGLSVWSKGAARNPVGLVVGAERGRREVSRAWVVSQDGHNLLIGAPGAGKSTRLIAPTLSVIAAGGESALVNDPKGELFQMTAGTFLLHDYEVARFDLRDPDRSVRWNPLKPIVNALARKDFARATRLARELAQILTAQGSPAGGNDAFWRESTVSLVTSLVLAVADQAEPEARNLASVYRTLTETKDLDAFFSGLPLGHPAMQAYGAVRLSGGETRQSQLTVAAVALSLFADPGVAWLTSGDEFDPASLGAGRRAVYVVVPDDSAAFYPIAALFVAQVLQALAAVASSRADGRLPVPVHFVLDEFGSLPRLPDFEKALAVARGRGIRINLVLQAFSQMDAVYGADTAQTMRNVCNTWVYLSSNDPATARTVSEKAWQTTVATTSQGLNWQNAQVNRNQTYASTARALLTPDEVLRWPFGESLSLQGGQLPARLPLRLFTEWPESGFGPPEVKPRLVALPATWAPSVNAPEPPTRRWAPAAVGLGGFPEPLDVMVVRDEDGLDLTFNEPHVGG
jgi:type IV secretion system protein VirD4